MEKILFKRIGLMFVVLLFMIVTVFSCYIYVVESQAIQESLKMKLEQLYTSYNNSLTITKEIKSSFEDDYMNRANSIAYMLSKTELEDADLSQMKSLIQAQAVHLIDENGYVVASSEEKEIQDNLLLYEEGLQFQNILAGKSDDAIIIWDAVSLLQDEASIYIGIPSTDSEYTLILIAIPSTLLENCRYFTSIRYVLESIPDSEGKEFFVVDGSTGDVKGTSLNTTSTMEIEGVNNQEEFVEVLQECKGGQVIHINDKAKYVYVIENEGYLYCAYYDGDLFFRKVIKEIIYVLVGISTMFICVVLFLRLLLKKVVIDDLRGIETNIRKLIQGNYEVCFQAKYPTEFQDIVNVMNDWKDSYKYKSNRMTRISSAISQQIGTFECLYGISQCFFSDNVKKVLSLSDQEWKEISKSPQCFEQFIVTLQEEHMIEDGIIQWKNKYLKILSFRSNGEFYGMIMDNSEEVEKQHKMKHQLDTITKESMTDALTKLANRKKLEIAVKETLQDPYPSGMMLIFDLDNFKRVNDEAGHPEGDKVLVEFAQILLHFFRKNDIVSRIGGDEFVVFIENIMPDKILHLKMRLLQDNIRNELAKYYQAYNLSTSIGIAYIDNRIHTFEELYRCADNALYYAKKNGKNRYYINDENIRCLNGNCTVCTGRCKRNDLLNRKLKGQ